MFLSTSLVSTPAWTIGRERKFMNVVKAGLIILIIFLYQDSVDSD